MCRNIAAAVVQYNIKLVRIEIPHTEYVGLPGPPSRQKAPFDHFDDGWRWYGAVYVSMPCCSGPTTQLDLK